MYFHCLGSPSVVRRKLVVVGDRACGKSSLLFVLTNGGLTVPTVFEEYVTEMNADGTRVELALFDTAAQSEYDRIRPLSYPDTHLFLVCFSIDVPDSLESVLERWVPEVRSFYGGQRHVPVPIILVGCKADLRADRRVARELRHSGQVPVTSEQGIAMQHKIGASAYRECSAKTGEGVNEVFHAVAAAPRRSPTLRPEVTAVNGIRCRKKNYD
ncbi:P-loop containing nucleoside triphosphate hydrolase protein [Mycena pura]|uniref:P-loop containing nucleoside triphosphate hydrolase protein n=1 Tax=Mycena pura TaxID=153505 RepID=A0AAD6V0E1_9AGAR|nr:P-loop containing nucleoside triphosphate hydrolase protein [Mycena pura]